MALFYSTQSRYYNPEIGRFINTDGLLSGNILGNNLYTYVLNNPVIYSDSSGYAPVWVGKILAGAVAVLSVATGVGSPVGAVLIGEVSVVL